MPRRGSASSLSAITERGTAPLDDVGELVVVEDDVDALVGDDVGELRSGEPGVEVHEIGAELGGRDDAR